MDNSVVIAGKWGGYKGLNGNGKYNKNKNNEKMSSGEDKTNKYTTILMDGAKALVGISLRFILESLVM